VSTGTPYFLRRMLVVANDSVAFSPDGKSLVSGSLDRTLRVWDLSATKRAVESSMPGSKEGVEKGLGTCQSTLNGHKVCPPSTFSSLSYSSLLLYPPSSSSIFHDRSFPRLRLRNSLISGLRSLSSNLPRWTMGSFRLQRPFNPILEYSKWTSSIHVARAQEFSYFN
jgi:WD40 repeat protein